jgi:hypothetical protein
VRSRRSSSRPRGGYWSSTGEEGITAAGIAELEQALRDLRSFEAATEVELG